MRRISIDGDPPYDCIYGDGRLSLGQEELGVSFGFIITTQLYYQGWIRRSSWSVWSSSKI